MIGIIQTHRMRKRLQVLGSEAEYEQIKDAATRQGATVGEFVRQQLKHSCDAADVRPADIRLRTIRKALGYDFPSADIEQMNDEIEAGYCNGLP
jgi:hypothetical protein